MDTQPSKPVAREKPIPVTTRRRVGGLILACVIGLVLGVIGGIAAGFISLLIGNFLYPSLGMALLALLLGPMIMFPIAGLCTGLVTAAQRSVERGAIVGAVLFGGSYFVLSIPSIAEFPLVVASVIIAGAITGALIGAMSVAVSGAASSGSSAQNHATLEARK